MAAISSHALAATSPAVAVGRASFVQGQALKSSASVSVCSRGSRLVVRATTDQPVQRTARPPRPPGAPAVASPPTPPQESSTSTASPTIPSVAAAAPAPSPPVAAAPSKGGVVTIEFQRQRAKEMTAYFQDLKFETQVREGRVFGWTRKNEISNGRWTMFGFAVGLLTEFATGVNFPDQLAIIISNLGIADLD